MLSDRLNPRLWLRNWLCKSTGAEDARRAGLREESDRMTRSILEARDGLMARVAEAYGPDASGGRPATTTARAASVPEP